MIQRSVFAFILGFGLVVSNALPACAAYHHRVPYGTPVQMRLDQPISSRDMHEGDYIALRCVYNVVVDGYIVIAKARRASPRLSPMTGPSRGASKAN